MFSGAAFVHAEFDPSRHVGNNDIVVIRPSDPEPGDKGEPYWVAKVTKVQ